jgi:hypothetical protein
VIRVVEMTQAETEKVVEAVRELEQRVGTNEQSTKKSLAELLKKNNIRCDGVRKEVTQYVDRGLSLQRTEIEKLEHELQSEVEILAGTVREAQPFNRNNMEELDQLNEKVCAVMANEHMRFESTADTTNSQLMKNEKLNLNYKVGLYAQQMGELIMLRAETEEIIDMGTRVPDAPAATRLLDQLCQRVRVGICPDAATETTRDQYQRDQFIQRMKKAIQHAMAKYSSGRAGPPDQVGAFTRSRLKPAAVCAACDRPFEEGGSSSTPAKPEEEYPTTGRFKKSTGGTPGSTRMVSRGGFRMPQSAKSQNRDIRSSSDFALDNTPTPDKGAQSRTALQASASGPVILSSDTNSTVQEMQVEVQLPRIQKTKFEL